MAPPKGTTNNPNGRPKKTYALTEALVKEFSRTIEIDGKRVNGKRVLAELVTRAVLYGRVKFPGDSDDSVLSVKDWTDFVRWAYQYLEPPIQRNEVTGTDGGPITWRQFLEGQDE